MFLNRVSHVRVMPGSPFFSKTAGDDPPCGHGGDFRSKSIRSPVAALLMLFGRNAFSLEFNQGQENRDADRKARSMDQPQVMQTVAVV